MTQGNPGRTGVELVLTEVGPAAGGEAEVGLENILIGLAAVILGHRAA